MNYPSYINKKYNKVVNYANRGMDLEYLVNEANTYYLENDIAVIYKKPTPIGIRKTDYKNKTINGFFKEQSTLDYNGVYKGYYIDFDAKVTNCRTSFPLSNIHKHQLEHIKKVIKHKGIAFLIIYINNEYYLAPGNKLLFFIESNTRKSIPYNYIKDNFILINLKLKPTLDYIKAVDILIKEIDYGKEK